MKKAVRILSFILAILLVVLVLVVFFQSRSGEKEKKTQKADPVRIVERPSKAEASDESKDVEATEKEETAKEEESRDTDAEAIEKGEAQSAGGNVQELTGRLQQLVSTEYGAGGQVAVSAGRISEGELASVGGGPMQAASLIKLYVAGCVYENYGTVSGQDTYGGETDSLLRSMITVSDNDACNTLVARLGSGSAANGMSLVNQYCGAHGFSDTHMGRLMLQPNDADDNYTSVRDCCNFLKMAGSGQLEGGESILGLMNQQQRRSKIPAGIPAGVTVGNKTGELSDVENDAAIVYAAGGTYVICVMSENLSNPGAARQFITRSSGVVYEMLQ